MLERRATINFGYTLITATIQYFAKLLRIAKAQGTTYLGLQVSVCESEGCCDRNTRLKQAVTLRCTVSANTASAYENVKHSRTEKRF
jgi:predicted transcriptional regulator